MLRNSLRFVTWKDRKAVALALKPIYSAQTDVMAEAALTAFEASAFGVRYPMIGKSWRANWQRVIPFLAFPREIRKVIYTTNAIESLNYSLRKIIKTRGHFPSEEAATKLLYLALIRAEQRWTMPIWRWKDALNQFAVHFDGRLSI
jgi:Transposase and inactivated derivatives